MFLQILPSDYNAKEEFFLDNQLIFVVLGLAISVFVILRVAKFLSKININKVSEKPSFTS